MNKARSWLIVFPLALVACGEYEKISQARMEKTEKSAITDSIKTNLIDPDSAKIGLITINKKLACATVNSKNRFGGYAGEQVALLMKYESHGWFVVDINRKMSYEKCVELMPDMEYNK